MLSGKMKALAIGAAAAFSLAGAPAAHAQVQVTIGVAANFAGAVSDLITRYAALNHISPGIFAVQIDSTGVLRTCITTPSTDPNYATACPIGHYDLFLAADTTTPAALAASTNPVYGMNYNGTVQAPFFYATGSLELYSPITGTDISAGLPSTLTVPLVIANPASAPYGFAAMTVLNTAPWSLGLATNSAYPVGFVNTAPNIGVTYESVKNGNFAYGFVHKSAICKLSGTTETFNDGAGVNNLYHHEYLFDDSAHPYGQIVQDGLAIELGQASTVKDRIISFIAYLHGAGGTGVLNGLNIIKSYCYGTTEP